MLAEMHPVCVENFHVMNIEVPVTVGAPSHPTLLHLTPNKWNSWLEPHYMIKSANQMVLFKLCEQLSTYIHNTYHILIS